MADAEAKKRVQKVIAEKVKPAADDAFKGIASSVPELVKAMKKVSDGLHNGEYPAVMMTHRRELAIRMRAVTAARSAAIEALDALEDATKDDDDFEADEQEIEQLQLKLTKAKTLLADQIVKAKDLEDKAAAGAKHNLESEKSAHRDWDTLIALFESQLATAVKAVKELKKAQQDGEAAVKARDAAALKAARAVGEYFIISEEVMQGKLLKKRVNEFLSKYDLDNFSKDFLQEMAKDRATTVDVFDQRAQQLMTEMSKLKAAILKLAIEPPNAAKATAALGFKATFNTKVEAALKLDDAKMAKALEDLAKQAGVKASGKELVEKLKKAKLL